MYDPNFDALTFTETFCVQTFHFPVPESSGEATLPPGPITNIIWVLLMQQMSGKGSPNIIGGKFPPT